MIRHASYILFFISLSFLTIEAFSSVTSCNVLLKNNPSYDIYDHEHLSQISLAQWSKLRSQKTLKNRLKKQIGRESISAIEEEFDKFLLNPQIYIWDEMKAASDEALELEYSVSLFLRFGKIVRKKKLPIGDNRPELITLENGLQAILKWRNHSNSGKEVAAYIVDRELGFNLVPLTVQRPHQGYMASVQLRVLDLDTTEGPMPEEIKLFNFLINKTDVHWGNWLKTIEGKNISIDHDSYTFKKYSIPLSDRLGPRKFKLNAVRSKISETRYTREHDYFTEKSENFFSSDVRNVDKSKSLNDAILSRPDVIAKLKTIEPSYWRSVLSPLISADEVEAFIKRRSEVLAFFKLI